MLLKFIRKTGTKREINPEILLRKTANILQSEISDFANSAKIYDLNKLDSNLPI